MSSFTTNDLKLNLYVNADCKHELIPIHMDLEEGISRCGKAAVTVLVHASSIAEDDFKVLLDKLAEIDLSATYHKNDGTTSEQHRYFGGYVTEVRVCGIYDYDSRQSSEALYYFEVRLIIESPMAKLRYSLHNRSFNCSDQNVIDAVFKPIFDEYKIDYTIAMAQGQNADDSKGRLFYQRDESDRDFLLEILTSLGWSFIYQTKEPQQNGGKFTPSAPELLLSTGSSYTNNSSETVTSFSCVETGNELNYMSSWQTADRLSVDRLRTTFITKGKAVQEDVHAGDDEDSPYCCDMNSLPFSMSDYTETSEEVANNYLNALHLFHADWSGKTMILSGTAPGSAISVLKFYNPADESNGLSARVTASKITCDVQPDDVLLTGKTLPEPDQTISLSSMKRDDKITTPIKAPDLLAAPSAAVVTASSAAMISQTNAPEIVHAIVCDENGYTDGVYGKTNLTGSETLEANLPVQLSDDYKFHAYLVTTEVEEVKFGSGTRDKAKAIIDVKLMMPLGGLGEGLFHVPRLSDHVLLLRTHGTEYYLAGYLPSDEMKFSGTLALANVLVDGSNSTDVAAAPYRNNEITVLRQNDPYGEPDYVESDDALDSLMNHPKSRRKLAGDDEDDRQVCNEFSEIGIYGAMKDASGNLIKDGLVNLASQYDLNVSANKEVYVEGRNIEIACPGNADRWTDDGETSKDGIVSIHEVSEVVIQAEHGIQLQCGTSSISLTPEGIVINSGRETDVDGPIGASISLNPFLGTNVSGSRVSIDSFLGTSLSASPDASVDLNASGVGISGSKVEIGTSSIENFISGSLTNLFQMIDQCVAMGEDKSNMSDSYKTYTSVYNDMLVSHTDSIIESINSFVRYYQAKKAGEVEDCHNAALIGGIMGLVMFIAELVIAAIRETQTNQELYEHEEGKSTTLAEDLDIAMLAFIIAQWCVFLVVDLVDIVKSKQDSGSTLQLKRGQIGIDTKKLQKITPTSQEFNTIDDPHGQLGLLTAGLGLIDMIVGLACGNEDEDPYDADKDQL